MGKLPVLPLPILCVSLMLVIITMPMANGIAQGPTAVETWFNNLSHAKEKVTKFHFYWHDWVTGKTITDLPVVQGNKSLTGVCFGLIDVFDNPLTVGPEPNSTMVGRSQGLYGCSDLHEVGLIAYYNFVFTEGEYNGSTLSMLGRVQPRHTLREMTIVGGTGVFRLARGIATSKTYLFNTTNGDVIAEYNLFVVHY